MYIGYECVDVILVYNLETVNKSNTHTREHLYTNLKGTRIK